MDRPAVIDLTRRWIASVVIGMNLCPFARRVFDSGLIRYAVTDADGEAGLLDALDEEIKLLAVSPITEIETTVLIHPNALGDFLDYNDFLDAAERLIARRGQEGVLQIASFHPDYQFAETAPDAVENYSNRSPFPMLHLLREESITAVADDPDALLEIPRRNVETLNALGRERMLEMLRALGGGGRG
jgi:hypothetical protein